MQARPVARRPAPLLDRFDLVLALVLVSIVVQSLVDVRGSYAGRFVTHAVSGAALVVATRASGAGPRARRAMDAFIAVGVVGNLVLVLVAGSRGEAGPVGAVQPDALWFLAAAATPVLVVRRLVLHERVRAQTVLGAVAAYLQLAVAYSLLFQTIDGYTDGHFFGEDVSSTVYMYVSLATIATLGYGDFVPVTDLGRLAAMTEAVVGQVYLVTFVAMVVSRFAAAPVGSNRRRRVGQRLKDGADTADSDATDATDATGDVGDGGHTDRTPDP